MHKANWADNRGHWGRPTKKYDRSLCFKEIIRRQEWRGQSSHMHTQTVQSSFHCNDRKRRVICKQSFETAVWFHGQLMWLVRPEDFQVSVMNTKSHDLLEQKAGRNLSRVYTGCADEGIQSSLDIDIYGATASFQKPISSIRADRKQLPKPLNWLPATQITW